MDYLSIVQQKIWNLDRKSTSIFFTPKEKSHGVTLFKSLPWIPLSPNNIHIITFSYKAHSSSSHFLPPDSIPATLKQPPDFQLLHGSSLFLNSLPTRISMAHVLLLYTHASVILPDRPLIILPLPCFIFPHVFITCLLSDVSPFCMRTGLCFVLCYVSLCLEQRLSCRCHYHVAA